MAPELIVLDSVVRGDTWVGIPSITIKRNGAPPSNAAASARMHFKKTAQAANPALSLSSPAEGIVVSDSANWVFVVSPRVLSLGAGDWLADFETTDAVGTIWTPIQFKLTVLQDITR